MPFMLPPCVVGPVYTFSTVVKVVSALHGAAVQLLQNGTPVAGTAVADSTGTAVIALGAASLSGGDTITAMQSLSGDQSQAGPGTTVLDVPGSLSPPIYLSMVHTCVDAVVLGGLQVGAVVEVTSGGKLLGSDVADATEIAVSLPAQAACRRRGAGGAADDERRRAATRLIAHAQSSGGTDADPRAYAAGAADRAAVVCL